MRVVLTSSFSYSHAARLGSSRFNTQIARIVVGGMEVGAPRGAAASAAASADAATTGSGTRTLRGAYARASPETAARLEAAGVPSVRVSRSLADVMFGDDDSDDDEEGFSGFVNSIRNMDSMRGASFSFSGLPGMHLPPPPPPPRSFATNMHDAGAGGSAEHALEIQDSDDDDDEVVVVGSRRSSQRSAAGNASSTSGRAPRHGPVSGGYISTGGLAPRPQSRTRRT